VPNKKKWHEMDGDQHQGKDGHQISVRLNLKCVPRRRSQETQTKRISEVEKTKHVPRHNKTCRFVGRSRISSTYYRCQEVYDDVAQSSGQGKEAGQRPCCREDHKNRAECTKKLHSAPHGGRALPVPIPKSLGRQSELGAGSRIGSSACRPR
jgi:hypothetical protein